jgi:hypothetical protein
MWNRLLFARPAALLCFFAGVNMTFSAETASRVFRSGPAQVALIELYTSEGCSSCPPAEKWLGELRHESGLWRDFVPVAFHVNYWDHLGWRDALASKAFTDREHAYASAWGSNSVYTPCFVRNGTEWRPGQGAIAGERIAHAGMLTLTWTSQTRTCNVEYTPPVDAKPVSGGKAVAPRLEVSVALLGSGIVNQVRKGENAGRELRHEFVTLRFETAPLERDENGTYSARVILPPRTDIAAPRQAIAGWVTPRGKLTPLQATGGWSER